MYIYIYTIHIYIYIHYMYIYIIHYTYIYIYIIHIYIYTLYIYIYIHYTYIYNGWYTGYPHIILIYGENIRAIPKLGVKTFQWQETVLSAGNINNPIPLILNTPLKLGPNMWFDSLHPTWFLGLSEFRAIFPMIYHGIFGAKGLNVWKLINTLMDPKGRWDAVGNWTFFGAWT